MKKVAVITAILGLMLVASSILTPVAFAAAPPPLIKRPMDLLQYTIEGGSPETVDYSWAYDTASGEIIQNTMDTLIMFNGEHTDQFLPGIATNWTIQPLNGGLGIAGPDPIAGLTFENDAQPGPTQTWYYRYTFTIRPSVWFHPPWNYSLTPEDVAYSFQRTLIQDRSAGPQWMLEEPLLDLNAGTLDALANLGDPANVSKVGALIRNSVQYNDTCVWFNMMFPGAYAPFMQILCQTWSSIMSKQWINNQVITAAGRPDWNGDWSTTTAWINYHNPTISPLDSPTPMPYGSGPYILTSLDYSAKEWTVVRYQDYWGGWPSTFPLLGPVTPAGYADTAEVSWAFIWIARKAAFLAGDCDFVAVPGPANYPELYTSATPPYDPRNYPLDGIRCIHPLPELSVDACFFTFNIDPTSLYGTIGPPGAFSETWIPSDFFGNAIWGINVRKAFAQAFPHTNPTHSTTVQLQVTPIPSFDFNVSATPVTQSVAAGGAVSYAVTVSLTGGAPSSVALTCSGLPFGATATFIPNPGSPTFTSTLNVATLPSTPSGSYRLTIDGTSGSLVHSTSVQLQITPLPPPPLPTSPFDFSVSAAPTTLSVAAGNSTEYQVDIILTSGISEPVNLTCSGLPPGVTATFTPLPPMLRIPTFYFNLTVQTSSDTPIGNYALTITAATDANFISNALLGEAVTPTPATAIIPGLNYYDPTVTGWSYNLAAANASFNAVPGLATTGFTIQLVYNLGNEPRHQACLLLKQAIERLNPRYHCIVVPIDWRTYLTQAVNHQLPCFINGWLADFPDPHDFALPFYHTGDAFAAWQAYSNAAMDALIDLAINTPDGPARAGLYRLIQVLAVSSCPSFIIDQPVARHFERDWINGWYYNTVYPSLYFYVLWKWYYIPEQLDFVPSQPHGYNLPADVNYDGKVDIKDISTVAKAFGSLYGPPINPRWVFRADINNDRKIDIKDIAYVAQLFGKQCPSGPWPLSTVTITSLPPPTSPAVPPNIIGVITIHLGNSITFTTTVTVPTPAAITINRIDWINNGNPVPSAHSTVWTFTPATPGVYNVKVDVFETITSPGWWYEGPWLSSSEASHEIEVIVLP